MTVLLDRPSASHRATSSVADRRGGPASDLVRAAAKMRVGTMLKLVSALLLGFVAFIGLFSQVSQHRAQVVAQRDFRLALAKQVAPLGPAVPGTAVAYLSVPRIGLHQIVREGSSAETLADGPGHRRDTVLPGQFGTSVLLGRRAAYGAPFRRIAELRKGDEIAAVTAQGASQFLVLAVRHQGDPLPPQVADGGGRLTLVTAGGKAFLPSRAVYVDADLVGHGKPGFAPLATIPPSEQTLSVESAASLPLALWSQALLVLAGLLVVLRRAWGRWPTYVCGLPVVLLVLWNLYDTAARLLPNVL